MYVHTVATLSSLIYRSIILAGCFIVAVIISRVKSRDPIEMAGLPSMPFHSFVDKHESKESKTDTSTLSDPGKLTDRQKLMNITQSDNASCETGKGQVIYNEALPDLKSSNTDPERELPITDSEQFECSLQQSNELDQDQVVPEASSSSALETAPNQSPFVYDEHTMVSQYATCHDDDAPCNKNNKKLFSTRLLQHPLRSNT